MREYGSLLRIEAIGLSINGSMPFFSWRLLPNRISLVPCLKISWCLTYNPFYTPTNVGASDTYIRFPSNLQSQLGSVSKYWLRKADLVFCGINGISPEPIVKSERRSSPSNLDFQQQLCLVQSHEILHKESKLTHSLPSS